MRRAVLLLLCSWVALPLLAESCTTQSAMAPAIRSTVAEAAQAIAGSFVNNDVAALRSSASPDILKNFGSLQYLAAVTSPKLAGGTPEVDQVYLLDTAGIKANADGSLPEAQFFCMLNKSANETQFTIAGLTSGHYAFAIVTAGTHQQPWRLAMLLEQQGLGTQAKWTLAGIYPKATTLSGHDGLWFWTDARLHAKQKQLWNAWLEYRAAADLLQPAGFVTSTHLEALRTEAQAATPPPLSDGISNETPLIVRAGATTPFTGAPAGSTKSAAPAADLPKDFRFTAMQLTEPAVGSTSPTLALRMQAGSLPDPDAARKRNTDAARALLAAYPELNGPYATVSITTESAGQAPYRTEIPLSELH